MIYKWAALASLLLFSCLSKHVSTLITHHLAAFSPGFWRLPFTGFFLTNLSKTELTMSGAPSWGQTYWRETKQVSIQLDAAIVLHLSVREKEWISWDTKVNFLFLRLCFHQVSHHPPISACHAESGNFVFWQGNVLIYLTSIILCNGIIYFIQEPTVNAC